MRCGECIFDTRHLKAISPIIVDLMSLLVLIGKFLCPTATYEIRLQVLPTIKDAYDPSRLW